MTVDALESPQIAQIGLVVHDAESTAARYCRIFDIPMPEAFVAGGEPPAIYRGKSVPAGLRGVAFDLGKVQIEFLEPTDSSSAWADFLNQHGEGVHHVAFAVSDTNKAVESFAQHGYTVVQQGKFSNGEGMYTYLDTDKDLGLVVELMQRFVEPPPHPENCAPSDRGFGTDVVVQIALVVNDIEATKVRISDVFGLAIPDTIATPGREITESTYRGLPSDATAKLAFFDFGQLQLELIEPDSLPSVWRDHLDAHGQSVHHIAFRVDDTDRVLAYFAGHEISVIQQGLYGDRSGMYTYLDTKNNLGVELELLESFAAPR